MDYLKQLRNKYTVYLGDLPEVVRVQSGIIGIDYITCGGLAKGRVCELFGPNGIGKSATALALCKSYIDQGLNAIYIDAERTITYEDLDRIGINHEDLLIMRPNTAEQAVSFIDDVCHVDHPVDLIILDSIPVLEPEVRLEKLTEDPSAAEMAIKARFYASLQGWLLPIIERTGTTIVMTNQIRASLNMYGPSVSTPGGNALKHLFSYRIELRGNTKIVDETSGAIKTKFIGVKNKLGNKGLEVEVDITANGIDNCSTMFNLLKQEKLITNKGAWYHYTERAIELGLSTEENTKIAQGIQGMVEALRTDKELYSKFYSSLVNIARTKRSNRIDTDPE